MNMYFFLF